MISTVPSIYTKRHCVKCVFRLKTTYPFFPSKRKFSFSIYFPPFPSHQQKIFRLSKYSPPFPSPLTKFISTFFSLSVLFPHPKPKLRTSGPLHQNQRSTRGSAKAILSWIFDRWSLLISIFTFTPTLSNPLQIHITTSIGTADCFPAVCQQHKLKLQTI